MRKPHAFFGLGLAAILLFGPAGVAPGQQSAGQSAPAAAEKPKGTAFAGEKDPEARRSLYQQWKQTRPNQKRNRTAASEAEAEAGAAVSPESRPVLPRPQLVNGENVGRASMVINNSGTVLFTRILGGTPTWTTGNVAVTAGQFILPTSGANNPWRFEALTSGTTGAGQPAWPATLGTTIVDGGVTWISRTGPCDPNPIRAVGGPGFPAYAGGRHNGDVGPGCQPIQLVSRSSGGVETVIAQEGDLIPGGGGSVLAGWGEYVAMNNSGTAAFKAAFAPTGTILSVDENGAAVFAAGPGGGALTQLMKSGDVLGNQTICGFGTMVLINDAGQVGFEGYPVATPWKPSTSSATFVRNRVVPTTPNGFYFTVNVAGTTGVTEPVWPAVNGATVTDGTVVWRANTFDCRFADEDNHQVLRFTPGPGVQLLLGVGTDIGGGVFVNGIGQNNDAYDNLDRHFNSVGHKAIVAKLSDGGQAAYLLTGPGAFTQVARTGVTIPGIGLVDHIGDKLALNNADQIVMKLSIGGDGNPSTQDQGADTLVLFTPPATYTMIAQGRTGPLPGGQGGGGRGAGPLGQVVDGSASPPITLEGIGAHLDMNNLGDVVFKAGLEQCSPPTTCLAPGGSHDDSELASIFFWDKASGVTTEIARTGKPDDRALPHYGFFTETVSVNDAKTVFLGTRKSGGSTSGFQTDDQQVAVYKWSPGGGLQTQLRVGDNFAGGSVSAIFGQHLVFSRHMNQSGLLALEVFTSNDDPDDAGDSEHNGRLFLSGVSCNAPAAPVLGVSPATVGVGADATLTWNGTLAPGSGNYEVYRAAGGPFVLLATVPATSAGPFSYTYTAAGPNGAQDFQVRAVPSCNPALFSRSNIATLTVTGCLKPPPPPLVIVDKPILPVGAIATLTWDSPSPGFAGTYTIKFSMDGGATFQDFAAAIPGNQFAFRAQYPAGTTIVFEVVADPGCGPASVSDPSPTVTVLVVQACPRAGDPVALVDQAQVAVGDSWSLHWTAALPVVGGVTAGIYEVRISQDNGATFHVAGTTTGTTFTGGPVPQGDLGKLIFLQVVAKPSCGTGGLSDGSSNTVFFTVLPGQACAAPQAASSVSIAAAGVSPVRPPSPIEYVLTSWLGPASGPVPVRYGVRINGDPDVLTTFNSLIFPPRGGKDPITAFVTAYTCGTLISAEVFAGAGTWSPTGSLGVPRQSHTATLLPGGKVLAAGGTSTPFGPAIASAEVFDPGTGGWSPTANLTAARQSHAATALSSGKVLVSGGVSAGLAASSVFHLVAEDIRAEAQLSSAELYDPVSKTWSAAGNLATARAQHTATLLSNGKVLVAGGRGAGPLNSAELYDPTTGLWSATGPLQAARLAHTATLLPNGKVLVAGGVGASGALASAELYDPSAGAWTPTGSLGTAREGQTATLLSTSGKVLVSGGDNGSVALKGAELFDPAAGTWNPTGNLGTARTLHTATLLPGGAVLAAGGSVLLGPSLKSAELYDPAAGTWSATGSLNGAHGLHSATLLSSGSVLLAGLPDAIGPEKASPTAQSATVALFLTPPGADFTISPNPVVGQPVTFTDTSNPQATGWLWIFDDGTTDSRQSPAHVFTRGGTHTVALDATNSAGSQTKLKSFVVSAAAVATASRQVESAAFDASNPVRQRATVALGAEGSTWLHVTTRETQDTTLFLRFTGKDGALQTERRLVVSPGAEAVYDLAAWGLKGTFSVEIVCDRSFSAWIVRTGRPGTKEITR